MKFADVKLRSAVIYLWEMDMIAKTDEPDRDFGKHIEAKIHEIRVTRLASWSASCLHLKDMGAQNLFA